MFGNSPATTLLPVPALGVTGPLGRPGSHNLRAADFVPPFTLRFPQAAGSVGPGHQVRPSGLGSGPCWRVALVLSWFGN